MDGTTYTQYSFRYQGPTQIERGKANTIEVAAYIDGAISAPSSGTVSVYKGDGTAVVNAQAVTIASSKAQYLISAGTLPTTLELEPGWRIEWALVMADTLPHNTRNDAILVRRRLYPVVSDADLYRVQPKLNPSATGALVASDADHQDQLDEAWTQILARLTETGTWPNRIVSPSALRNVHLNLTLMLIYRYMHAVNGDTKWERLADKYEAQYEQSWGRMSFLYDNDDDGEADSATTRKTAARSVWLGSGNI
jgi:hypothetical protein